MPLTTELSGTELCDTEQSSIRPPRPEHSVGKNLHANFRTRSVLVVVLISVTVLPLLFCLLGGVVNELTGTQWPGPLLALGLSLPVLWLSASFLRGLLRKGYVLVMNDQGVTYSQGKEPTEPVAWADILAVEDTLTLDKEDGRSAHFKVTYRQVQEDGSISKKSLLIDQSLLDVEREQIRAVFEDRIGPLDVVEQAQPESFGSKLERGVLIAVASAVTDRIMDKRD